MAPRVTHQWLSIDVTELTVPECDLMGAIIDATRDYNAIDRMDYYSVDYWVYHYRKSTNWSGLASLKEELQSRGFTVSPTSTPTQCCEVVYFKVEGQ